ncbi:MAG: hypothetical protein AB8H79_20910 [Myxococcota bacterium]
MSLSAHHFLLLLVFVAGCGKVCPWGGCPDTDPTDDTDPPVERVTTDPSVLRWDIAASDAPSAFQTVQFTNTGDVRVSLLDLEQIDNAVFELESSPGLFPTLDVGESLELRVRFNPQTGGSFESEIAPRLSGRSGTKRVSPISLIGKATGPSPSVSAPAVEDTTQWCSNESTVEFRNAGPDDMPIVDLVFGEEQDCHAFSFDEDELLALKAQPIPKDGLASLNAQFTPRRPGPHSCTFFVETALSSPIVATLRGNGLNTTEAQETWFTSDGTGAHVLFVHDDGAPDVASHRQSLATGLPTFVRALNTEGIDYRITAPSTTDGCTEPGRSFATAEDPESLAVSVLERNLFAAGTSLSNQPLRLMSDTLGPRLNPCFNGWLTAPDPVHVIVVSARDDDSRPSRSVSIWLAATAAEYDNFAVSAIVPTATCGEPPARLAQAVRDTGGQQFDLCESDWSSFWPALAVKTANMRDSKKDHRLLAVPLPGSVRIAVDGSANTNYRVDRRFDTSGDTPVELPPDIVLLMDPADGSEVDVWYADVGTCR